LEVTEDTEQLSGKGEFQASRPTRKAYAPLVENPLSAAAVPTVSNSIITLSKNSLEGRRASTGSRMDPSDEPTVEEGGEDDVPVFIRKSFKELRSVKDELERQV
jgi:hypothetical protein